MTETIRKTYQGTTYDFATKATALEFQENSTLIKNTERVGEIINKSKINERIQCSEKVVDEDVIPSRYIENYLFLIHDRMNTLVYAAWNCIVEEIIQTYKENLVLQGLTIWDEALGTVSEGYIYGTGNSSIYDDDDESKIYYWDVVFVDGDDIKNARTKLQRYTVLVISESGKSGMFPNLLPMLSGQGRRQFGNFSRASALEFFQLNGKRATRAALGGKEKGKEKEEEEGEEMDFEEGGDDLFESYVVTPTAPACPSFTPANSPILNKKRKALDEFSKVFENIVKEEKETLKKENETLKNEKETLENEKETLKNEKETLKNEKETLKNEKETLKNEKETLEKNLEEEKNKLQEWKNEITNLLNKET
jgi:hypothetical protein